MGKQYFDILIDGTWLLMLTEHSRKIQIFGILQEDRHETSLAS